MDDETLFVLEERLSLLLVAAVWNERTCRALDQDTVPELQQGILQTVVETSGVTGLLAEPDDRVLSGVEGGAFFFMCLFVRVLSDWDCMFATEYYTVATKEDEAHTRFFFH